MVGFELSIVINRPIEEVFRALTNLENDIKWRSEWVETRNTSGGAFGVGATFCLTGEFLGRRVPTNYEVIEYEPNLSAAWKTVSGPLPLKFQRTFERGEGGTRFTIKYEVEVRGLFKLLMSFLAGTVKRQHEGDGRFRHGRPVDAADICDQHLFAQRRQVNDIVDAGPERLDPFKLGRIAHYMVGHRRRKAQQDVCTGNVGADIVVMTDHIDRQLRKSLQQHRLVTGAHGFLDFCENEDVGHGGRRYSA